MLNEISSAAFCDGREPAAAQALRLVPMESCNCKSAAYSMCKRGLLGIPPRATGALEATALYRKLSLTLALAMTACILIVGAGVASAQIPV
jgi:hypothetical protein